MQLPRELMCPIKGAQGGPRVWILFDRSFIFAGLSPALGPEALNGRAG